MKFRSLSRSPYQLKIVKTIKTATFFGFPLVKKADVDKWVQKITVSFYEDRKDWWGLHQDTEGKVQGSSHKGKEREIVSESMLEGIGELP